MSSDEAFGKSSIGGLVITRRPGEQVVINHGEIVVEVVGVKGRYVRLAFAANKKEISIVRAEASEFVKSRRDGD